MWDHIDKSFYNFSQYSSNSMLEYGVRFSDSRTIFGIVSAYIYYGSSMSDFLEAVSNGIPTTTIRCAPAFCLNFLQCNCIKDNVLSTLVCSPMAVVFKPWICTGLYSLCGHKRKQTSDPSHTVVRTLKSWKIFFPYEIICRIEKKKTS